MPHGVTFTRDPGGVMLGEELRKIALSYDMRGIDPTTELLLFMAARAQLVAELIAPALEEGRHVVCDRFILSTIAYQIYGRQQSQNLPLVKSIFAAISKHCMPDATIYLDVDPTVGLDRVHNRVQAPNRFDGEDSGFHMRVREGYRKHLEDYGKPFTIDANRPVEEVWADVKATVQSLL